MPDAGYSAMLAAKISRGDQEMVLAALLNITQKTGLSQVNSKMWSFRIWSNYATIWRHSIRQMVKGEKNELPKNERLVVSQDDEVGSTS
jgi:hypothetical protein